MEPKVSVIVPVYNTEKYLTKCLDSLTNQTLSDIEIICINDASTDGSLKILQEYALRDDRIKVIDLKENGGVSKARNTGIDSATGEYIGFVDSDDFVDLDFYERLYNKAIETNADVVKGAMACLKNGRPDVESEAGYDINKLVRENKAYFFHSFTTAIYSSDLLKKNKLYFPLYRMFEDPYFSILVAIYTKKIYVLDEPKYYYVSNEQSATKSLDAQDICDITKSIEKIFSLLEEHHVDDRTKTIIYAFLIKQLQYRCWQTDISVPVNRKVLDLYAKAYLDYPDKEGLIAEYFKQQEVIRQSAVWKFVRNNFMEHKEIQ